jgi:hypothetical protein
VVSGTVHVMNRMCLFVCGYSPHSAPHRDSWPALGHQQGVEAQGGAGKRIAMVHEESERL